MKNHYEEIKTRLQNHPWFRERKAKNHGIARMLISKYKLDLNPIQLEQIIVEASSLDRVWRKVLQECPHLRGSDYEEKKILEQEAQINMGYEQGFHEMSKQVKLKL